MMCVYTTGGSLFRELSPGRDDLKCGSRRLMVRSSSNCLGSSMVKINYLFIFLMSCRRFLSYSNSGIIRGAATTTSKTKPIVKATAAATTTTTMKHRSGLLISNCNHKEESEPSPLVTMLWTLKIGARHEDPSTRGLSHYVMHSLFSVSF